MPFMLPMGNKLLGIRYIAGTGLDVHLTGYRNFWNFQGALRVVW